MKHIAEYHAGNVATPTFQVAILERIRKLTKVQGSGGRFEKIMQGKILCQEE
jgi:hypothetical protein